MGEGEIKEPWRGAVDETLRRITGVLNIEAVIVFGSWTRGGGGMWSDVDMLVVTDDVVEVNVLDRFRIAVELRPPRVDLFLYTYRELEAMVDKGNPLALSALIEGIPVKASDRVRSLMERARREYTRSGRMWVKRGHMKDSKA